MRVVLLGPVSAFSDDGRPLPVGGPRVRALLALLALEPGRVVSSARLIDAIWDEHPPSNTANALQTLVKRLRAACASDGPVEARSAGYRLAIDPEEVDAHRFAAGLRQAQRLTSEGAYEPAVKCLEQALAAWTGSALGDMADVTALAAAAVPLEEARLTAVELLADCRHRLGRSVESIRGLMIQAATRPMREPLVARLMVALASGGRRSEALALYQRTRELLAEELGIDPSEELSATYIDLLRRDDARSPDGSAPVASEAEQAAARTSLPHSLTSFVGRAAELAAVGGALATARLVTLTGPGGTGKTRLAIEAATRVSDRFPDGVRLVELAAVADSALVGATFQAALGIRGDGVGAVDGRVSVSDRLAAALGDRRMLLVVDNCEHLVDAVAAVIATLLDRCGGIRVLATSREPLAIAGESLQPVPPLELPSGSTDPAQAAGFTAVRLFVERAVSVRPDFVLDAENCKAVCTICRSLDGIPLALELAATRMRAMSPQDLARGLGDRFGLLAVGQRTAAARHQGLRAVVAWSWDLLTDTERRLAWRLSVFVGGATAETVEQMFGGDAVATLISLVDKSFVQWDGSRYRMLETIRAYAAEALTTAGEKHRAVLEAHADYFTRLAEEAEPALRTADQARWQSQLAAEHDNCVAALDWAVCNGEVSRALRLFGSFSWHLLLRGLVLEQAAWRRRVLALVPDGPPPGLTSAYLACAFAADVQGNLDPVRWRRMMDDPQGFPHLYKRAVDEQRPPHPLFAIVMALRELENGHADALGACVTSPDAWLSGNALLLRGGARLNEGMYDAATADLAAAAGAFRAAGDRRALTRALMITATVQVRTVGMAPASSLVAEAAGLAAAWSDADDAVATFTWIAHLRYWTGDLFGADADLVRARGLVTEGIPTNALAELGFVEADVLRERGDLPGALAAYAVGIRCLEAETLRLRDDPAAGAHPAAAHRPGSAPIPDKPSIGAGWLPVCVGTASEIVGRTCYALALIQNGNPVSARVQLDRVMGILTTGWNLFLMLTAGVAYAALDLAEGDAESAAVILGAVGALHGRHGDGGPDAIRTVGLTRAALGVEGFERAAAVGARMTARTFFELLLARWRLAAPSGNPPAGAGPKVLSAFGGGALPECGGGRLDLGL